MYLLLEMVIFHCHVRFGEGYFSGFCIGPKMPSTFSKQTFGDQNRKISWTMFRYDNMIDYLYRVICILYCIYIYHIIYTYFTSHFSYQHLPRFRVSSRFGWSLDLFRLGCWSKLKTFLPWRSGELLGCEVQWCCFWVGDAHSLKLTSSLHLKIGRNPKGKDRIATIHFQGRTVSFREGSFPVFFCKNDVKNRRKVRIPQIFFSKKSFDIEILEEVTYQNEGLSHLSTRGGN